MQDHQAYADWIKERRLTGRKSREIRARGGEENKEEKEEEEEEDNDDWKNNNNNNNIKKILKK